MYHYSKSLRTLAFCRRLLLAFATLLLVVVAAIPLGRGLGLGGWTVLKGIFFGLFIVLFSQVAFSFAVAVAGWCVLRSGQEAVRIDFEESPEGPLPATAIVMPIYNEDVGRVFQGLRAMYESLGKEENAEAFDFFILSDTSDTNCWVAEERAWMKLCQEVEGFGRIFYRKRRVQLHNKSGNIADFCRRWGASYRYMIVLDADSVMTGAAIVGLARLMEANPKAGIIQTSTLPILGKTLFQRVEQFAASVYRPIFTAGANFWQLNDATFWGHNAIIRVKPFMEHCAMPELPEVGPLGTRILSHDTIEAALMRRGGYEVWQAYDLEGSYEEGPPHLLASLERDRRWCHGNLQHLWFLFEHGLKPASRFNILNGILAYANSPIWLLSLCIGTLLPFSRIAGVQNDANPGVLMALALYAFIMSLLLAPKVLGVSTLLRSPDRLSLYGGRSKLICSVFLETVYSMLLGPILMLFYTRFVLGSFCGIKVGWGRQVRSDEKGPDWGTWVSVHGIHTLLVLGAADLLIRTEPWLLIWLAPVMIGPALAIPFSRFTASQRNGAGAKAEGLFVVPEETSPPALLEKLKESEPASVPPFFLVAEYVSDYGLLQAVLDPYINAIHVSMLRQRKEAAVRTRDYMTMLADRLLLDGPFVLTPAEKKTLLWDADAMLAMHLKLWSSPPSHLHPWWQAAFRHYVESSALSTRRSVSV